MGQTKDTRPRETTAGSLAEQLANAIPPVISRRLAIGGVEAFAGASITIRAWTPEREAAFALVREALQGALEPGTEALVSAAETALAQAAILTREAARDSVVKPLLEPALRDIEAFKARGIARLNVRNAPAFVDGIMRQVVSRIDLLDAQVKGAIEPLFGSDRLLSAIDQAEAESPEALSTVLVALERLRARAESERDRIDRDMNDAHTRLASEEELLKVIAVETGDASFFRRDEALRKLITSAQVNVPKLGMGRVTVLYLPLVRAGLPALQRALDDRIGRLRSRRSLAVKLLDELSALERDTTEREQKSGRVIIVGAPATTAAQNAGIERLVDAARGAVARRLRDLIVFDASPAVLLDRLLAAAAAAVGEHAPRRSLDDAVLSDVDHGTAARALDTLIEKVAIPVALSGNADRAFLARHRCSVLKVAAGSELPRILATEAGYRTDRFDVSGSTDRLEVLVLQPGIDLAMTGVFESGRAAYDDELADRTAPPVQVLGDEFLRALARATKKVTAKARSQRPDNGTAPRAIDTGE